MPLFRLITNLPREKIPKDFLKELTTVLAKSVGKPENKFTVSVIPGQLMTRGGSSEPCGTASLTSIGNVTPAENIAHSKVLFDKIWKDLGIPKNRLVIEFRDVKPYELANDGTTFEELNNKPK